MNKGISTSGDTSFRLNLALAVLAGSLLGFSFPPSPFYSLAYVAFIPFFFLVERTKSYGQLARFSYLFLLVFHIITLYWTGGFTHMRDPYLMAAGGSLILLHPFFFLPTILLSFYVRKRLGLTAGLIGFVFFWIGFEYVHSLSEFSFPWLTLGNSQAYDLYRIQIAEYTSTYGLSFLILAFNSVAFVLIRFTTIKTWPFNGRQAWTALALLLVLYGVPWIYGRLAYLRYSAPESSTSLRVGLVQPNIDPFEKWGVGGDGDPIGRQISIHTNGTRSLKKDSVDLVLWCETAIPFRILTPVWGRYWIGLKSTLDSIGLPVLSGFPYQEITDSAKASATAQRIGSSQLFAEDYNAVMLVRPGMPVREVYKKIKLVPFAERIPYANTFRFLVEPLKWSVGISGWGLGKDIVLFDLSTRRGVEERFAGMICYESVFPDFVREFVLRGAQFLVILTNDSWWGNTSGAYQHIAFASLRAVENRRWIIQCANGGISGFVDPSGTIHQATTMYTASTSWRDIEPRTGLTFYDRHGDIFALVCLIIGGGILTVAIVLPSQTRAKL